MNINLRLVKKSKLLLLVIVGGLISQGVAAGIPNEGPIPDHYIVTLQADVPAQAAASEMGKEHGLGLSQVYEHALNGFAAKIPEARLNLLRNDPRVVSIVQDRYVHAFARCGKPNQPPCDPAADPGGDGGDSSQPVQSIPAGVARINGAATGLIDVDVAVIDTGVDIDHLDLNVAGGYNCQNGPSSKYNDGNGHGTHVSGTIAAEDNAIGVIGVAPGARIWGVRVLNNAGSGSWASVICGIDWVTANADTIEVANMSLGGTGSNGSCSDGGMREAICNAVGAGVTFVVAAGNSATDANDFVPATYGEVITVSALADFNGSAGGGGSPTCRSDEDDTFANFSNYGANVDIIAPGVCIESTWNDGLYNTISGTSMASPHVAGAAALYLELNPGTSPAGVKSALQSVGNTGWDNSDDGDSTQEKLLDVSVF